MSALMGDQDKSEKKITLVDVVKFMGALGIIIPLILGYFEYSRSVQNDKDNYFRDLVEKLSSEKKALRLSGATNLGTFLWDKGNYYNEAVDILISAVALERDIGVLNAIRGSLEKIEKEDYKMVTQKLLDLERNSFVYDYPLEQLGLTEELSALRVQRKLVSSFLSTFLSLSREYPIDSLLIYQNSLTSLLLTDIKVPRSVIEASVITSSLINKSDFNNSTIVSSAFSISAVMNCDFSSCTISGSIFDYSSSLKNTSFRGSSFSDVFFTGSNIAGADFTGASGLKPVYFFGATNIDAATFDAEFKEELKDLPNMTGTEFRDYVYGSNLSRERMDELLANYDLYSYTE